MTTLRKCSGICHQTISCGHLNIAFLSKQVGYCCLCDYRKLLCEGCKLRQVETTPPVYPQLGKIISRANRDKYGNVFQVGVHLGDVLGEILNETTDAEFMEIFEGMDEDDFNKWVMVNILSLLHESSKGILHQIMKNTVRLRLINIRLNKALEIN